MNSQSSRRHFLGQSVAFAAGLVAAPALVRPAQADLAVRYELVNKTGRFSDDECFWSLDHGKTWHSFAKEPSVACPTGNGRMYFHLGPRPKNFDDREAIWDFIEYACGKDGVWHGNTTQVDAFCIPMTIALGEAPGARKLGITESRAKLFEAFRKEAPKEFQACVKSEKEDKWIMSPCRAGFGKGGPHAAYFDKYIDEVWAMYATETKTPSGKWVGNVEGGALTFTLLAAPTKGAKPVTHTCKSKPSSQDAFLGTGVLATNPAFCAAINRHVLADPADWRDAKKFYQAEPCNWYSKFLHDHSLDRKAYGFCYDDYAEQAAFFSGKSEKVVVTLTWD